MRKRPLLSSFLVGFGIPATIVGMGLLVAGFITGLVLREPDAWRYILGGFLLTGAGFTGLAVGVDM